MLGTYFGPTGAVPNTYLERGLTIRLRFALNELGGSLICWERVDWALSVLGVGGMAMDMEVFVLKEFAGELARRHVALEKRFVAMNDAVTRGTYSIPLTPKLPACALTIGESHTTPAVMASY